MKKLEFEDSKYKPVWDKFERMFSFNPSVDVRNWPGIMEPLPSYTISLTENDLGGYPDSENVIEFFKDAFNQLAGESKIAYILDWCHTCYHAPSHFDGKLWVYPDGDYAICLNESMTCGTFGHPWEKTICVFGEPLIEITRNNLPKDFSRVIRENTVY